MVVGIPNPRRAPQAALAADISSNNGAGTSAAFNPAAYASAGHLIATIKATEATSYTNPFWEAWATGAHQHGLSVMHYHFARLETPELEARHFWDTVRPHFTPHVDRVMVDIEVGAHADWPAWLAAYDQELHRLSGLGAIGYTSASALTPALKLRSRLWMVAAWGAKRPSGGLRGLTLPNGILWGWQYTDGRLSPSGGPTRAAGIDGSVDMTVLRNATVRNLRRAQAQHRKSKG